MGFIRKSIIPRLLLVLTAVLVPFEWIGTATAAQVDKVISFGIQSVKTISIRPFEPVERDMLSAYDLVYESLVVIDENYMPQPYLAERWEESSGGKYWTFYLRRDVKFTDGTPLTATDVVSDFLLFTAVQSVPQLSLSQWWNSCPLTIPKESSLGVSLI